MKKTVLLLSILFSFAFTASFAQKQVVTLGDLPANTRTDGKATPIYTTSDRIIKAGKLVMNLPNSEVVSYTFSIMKGDGMRGPITVKGAQLTDKVINWIKETKGPGVKVFFDEIKVKEKDGLVRPVAPMAFKYDQ